MADIEVAYAGSRPPAGHSSRQKAAVGDLGTVDIVAQVFEFSCADAHHSHTRHAGWKPCVSAHSAAVVCAEDVAGRKRPSLLRHTMKAASAPRAAAATLPQITSVRCHDVRDVKLFDTDF